MKLFTIIFLSFAFSGFCYASTHVRGYTKRDGTYVQPHYRSSPNNTVLDNYSTKGNINPYTGKSGTKDPYARDNQWNQSTNNNNNLHWNLED